MASHWEICTDHFRVAKKVGLVKEIDGQDYHIAFKAMDLHGRTEEEFNAFVDDLFDQLVEAFEKRDMEKCLRFSRR